MQPRPVPANAPLHEGGYAVEGAPRSTIGSGGTPGRAYRPDVDGLRALAVGLVVAHHAGVPFFDGGYVGVDVFFVVSGFLITGLLLDEVRRTGGVSIAGFYARRVRRLLPSSVLVLVVTLLATHLLLAPLAAERIDEDGVAVALYVGNWSFAAQAGDYFAAQVETSPLLHYWSLGVEEQFYVIWPLVILTAVGWGAARSRRGLMDRTTRRRVGLSLLAIAAGSFALSALTTSRAPDLAYYGLHTRAWELAFGAGLALLGHLGLTRGASRVAGWLGLGLILFAAMSFDRMTSFPGTAAAIPVIGTVLVLAAGQRTTAWGSSSLLSWRPLVHIGLISYVLYLWHWPVLTFARVLFAPVDPDVGPGPAPWWAVIAAVAVAYGLAVATHHLLEDPVRRSRWLAADRRRSLTLGLVLTAVPVVLVMLPLPGPVPVGLGAGAASAGAVPARSVDVPMSMTASEAAADGSDALGACHSEGQGSTVAADCVFGVADGKRTVALIGDSHAENWFPALERIATQRGWRLLVWTKGTCPVADVRLTTATGAAFEACDLWRSALLDRVAAARADLVIVGRSPGYVDRVLDEDGQVVPADAAATRWTDGLARSLDRLGDATPVLLLDDLPFAPSSIPDCLSGQPDHSSRCDFTATPDERELLLRAAEARVVADRAGTYVLDPTSLACPDAVCAAVAPDGTVTHRDAGHLTATFSRSLAPLLARAIDRSTRGALG